MWHYADELTDEYRAGMKELKRKREELKALQQFDETKTVENESDIRILGGMISDMQYAIDWLETAREPGSRRGISNRSRYQRTQLWAEIDVLSMQAFRMQSTAEGRELTEEERTRMNEILAILTQREREAYTCIHAEGHTYAQTAEYMGISRGAVQQLVNRAAVKIQNKLDQGAIQTALFY